MPTSLLAAMIDTSRTPALSPRGAGGLGLEHGGEVVEVEATGGVDRHGAAAEGQHRVEHGVVLDGRAHDGAVGRGEPGAPARPAPNTARLSDSVPPLVNTTSPGSAPISSATTSRASSMARRASRAMRWAPEGLAKRTSRNGSIASIASGRIGVVAAWSR